ncbi:MAG: 23S rRNA (adenine(2503)-C(2))-methyltransferase RlmN [Erysipelotrichaceae bacterium]|nr:23S rRNA (adenine(2503)-C(2))-methyltransferase RlmN [Erysipelotrichaceae bacterium]
MINLYGLTLDKLVELMLQEGQTKYRAKQLFTWIYEKGVTDFDEMSDISKAFREVLKEKYCLEKPKVFIKQIASDGTIKLLLEMEDGAKIETVLMRYNYGNVACVSSQVGCSMGCSFCASGLLKKQRNLLPHEMVGEILVLNDLLKESNERVTHVVVMGTGEPFDNYDNVMDFVRIVNDQKAFAIGARHITVSTCGIPDKIIKYGQEGLQINLAISLHAPNNELRNRIMKINKAYPLEVLIPAVKKYIELADRRVTYEYIMLKDVNDSLECAKELVELIKPTYAYVNLIPYNPVDEHGYQRAENSKVKAFMDYLMKHGVTTTIRKEFGTDIDAACGQLRAKNQRG